MRVSLAYSPLRESEALIPASKSLMHRALMASALATGVSCTDNTVWNDDTQATRDCLAQCGVRFELTDCHSCRTTGIGGRLPDGPLQLYCGESGSTLRFLIPLMALRHGETVLTGSGRLLQRPLSVYEDLFRDAHLPFETGTSVHVHGVLHGGHYRIPGNVSSQFVSGLMFALPLTEEDSELEIEGTLQSAPYVGLTMHVLEQFGIEIRPQKSSYLIAGRQAYHAADYRIAGDDSLAANLAVLAAVNGCRILLRGIDPQSKQSDHEIFPILERAGAEVGTCDHGIWVNGKELHGIQADLANCPDLGPILFAMAGVADGDSVFTHTSRLRLKESDRIAAMQKEMHELGYELIDEDDRVIVRGGRQHPRTMAHLDPHHDHRICMALSILASREQEPVWIDDADCVAKSWPAFFECLSRVGFRVNTL